MLHCDHCAIDLPGTPKLCPLCQSKPSGSPDESGNRFPSLPSRRIDRRLLAWMVFGSISVAAICVTINLILPAGGWWFLFVLAGIGSLWVEFLIMLKKRDNLPKSILWQVAVVTLIACIWDWLTGFKGWSVDYVLPILCTCAMVSMTLIAKIRRLHIQDYVLYLVIDCILGMVSFVLILTGSVRIVTPSAICFGASVIFLASLLSFEGKALWEEFQRRLHL